MELSVHRNFGQKQSLRGRAVRGDRATDELRVSAKRRRPVLRVLRDSLKTSACFSFAFVAIVSERGNNDGEQGQKRTTDILKTGVM